MNFNKNRVTPLYPEKYYVYALKKPDDSIFYIGKGKGDRINQHFQNHSLLRKSAKNNVILKYGDSVKRELLCYFDNEDDAYAFEDLLITVLGNYKEGGKLTNTGQDLSFNKISIDSLEKALLMINNTNMTNDEIYQKTGISSNHINKIFFRREARFDDISNLMAKHGITEIKNRSIQKPRKISATPEDFKFYHKLWLESEMSISEIAKILDYNPESVNRIFLGKTMKGLVDSTLKPKFRKTAVSKSMAEKIIYYKFYEKLSHQKISNITGIRKSTLQRVCELKGSYKIFEELAEKYKRESING